MFVSFKGPIGRLSDRFIKFSSPSPLEMYKFKGEFESRLHIQYYYTNLISSLAVANINTHSGRVLGFGSKWIKTESTGWVTNLYKQKPEKKIAGWTTNSRMCNSRGGTGEGGGGSAIKLKATSRIREWTEPAVFVPNVAKQHDDFVHVLTRKPSCWFLIGGNNSENPSSVWTKIWQTRIC